MRYNEWWTICNENVAAHKEGVRTCNIPIKVGDQVMIAVIVLLGAESFGQTGRQENHLMYLRVIIAVKRKRMILVLTIGVTPVRTLEDGQLMFW